MLFKNAAFNFDMNIQNMVARRKMNGMRFEFMYAILRLSYVIELPGERNTFIVCIYSCTICIYHAKPVMNTETLTNFSN